MSHPKSSGQAVDLLKSITRDPNYVTKLQETQDSGVGKNWDGRFTMSKMPQYDAVNDRFCKFNLRKRGNAKPAPKRSLLAGGMLPGGPNKPAWGANAEGYTTMTREHGGGPLPPVKTGQPGDLLNPVGALPQANPNAPQPGVPGAPVVDTATLGLIPQGQTLEGVWAKSKQRIIKLWDELGVAESDRLAFAQHAMVSPTGESVALMNEEIQRLLDRRNAAVAVEKGVEVREGFLYLLQELSERYATSAMEKERALRELNALIVPFRNASLDTVDAILRWREVQKTAAPYLWKGVSYLFKMSSDVYFLTFSKLGQLLDFDLKNNPLLDPRKELESVGGPAGAKLPPIRRAKDNNRMKDLPRERIERAERALAEEVGRQQQLSLSRAAGGMQTPGGNGGPGDGPIAYVEEEVHLANLVREDQEKNQIMVEEDAWLVAHQSKQQEKDLEETAATKIQTVYRGFMARRLVQAKITQRMAAIKMQTLSRQFIAKLHVERARKQMKAAKKIQALHRGVNTRSTISEIRHRHHCAQKIQCIFRGHMARKIADMLRYIRYNAITIQRMYRGHRVRKAVRHFLKVERDHYATIIQKHWRSYLVRRNPCNSPHKVQKVIKLQAWARGNLDRVFAKQLLTARRAATRLQAWWRRTSAMIFVAKMRRSNIDRGWEHRLHIAVVAVTKIQSLVRQYNAKKRCGVLREARADTLAKQATMLMEADAKRQEEAEHEKSQQAAKIQALARGADARKQAKMIRELNQCATEIQRIVRGRFGRIRAQDRHLEHIQELTELSCTPADMPSLIETTLLRLAGTPEKKSTDEEADTPEPTIDVSAVVEDKTPVKEDSNKVADVSGIANDDEGSSLVDEKEQANHDEDPKNEQSPSDDSNASPIEQAGDSEVVAARDRLDGGVPAEVPPSIAVAEEMKNVESKEEVVQHETKEVVEEAPAVVTAPATATKEQSVEDLQQKAALKIAAFMRQTSCKAQIERLRRSRVRSTGFTSRDVRNQETLYSVRILQNWFHSRLSRMHFVHSSSLKKAHDIHGRKERRQEETYAAILIQGAAKKFISRQDGRKQKREVQDKQRRQEIAAQRQALDQELEMAASSIQEFLRAGLASKKQQRHTRAVLAAREDQEVQARREEKEYAAGMVQVAIRSKLALLDVSHRRNSLNASSGHTEVQASGQAIEFAAQRIQGAARVSLSRRQVASKRSARAERDAAVEAEALAQESKFEVSTPTAAEDEPTVHPQPLVAPHSAFNVKHAHRGSCDVHVDFNADSPRHHAALPKDAELHSVDEEKLQQRIKELEDQLAQTEKRHLEAVEVEVQKRVNVEVEAKLAASPAKSDAVAAAATPQKYVDDVELKATNDDECANEASKLDSPGTPSESGFVSPGFVSPAPEADTAPIPVPTTTTAAPTAQPDAAIENKVAEGADNVKVVAAPATADPVGVPVESAQSALEEELSHAEKKELDDGFSSSPKAMKGLGALQKKAKNKKASPAAASPPAPVATETPNVAEKEEEELSIVEKKDDQVVATQDKKEEEPTPEVAEAQPEAGPQPEAPQATTTEELVSAAVAAIDEKEIATTQADQEQRRQTAERHKKAAIQIQSANRQRHARKKVDARRIEVEAERIEKMKRTEIELRLAADEKQRIQDAKDAEARAAKEGRAAEIIQRAYRSYNARFMLKWKRKERDEKRAQAKSNEERDRKYNAATTIQCMVRKVNARKTGRNLKRQRIREHQSKKDQEGNEYKAAVGIQCAWRSHNARFELKCRKEVKAKDEARQAAEKQKVEQRMLDQIAADETSRLELENNSKAALTMQLAWRSYNARFRKEELSRQKEEGDAMKVLMTTALRLQAVCRGASEREQLAKDYSKIAEARLKGEAKQNVETERQILAATVQPVGRGHMERANVAATAEGGQAAGAAIEDALNRAETNEVVEEKEDPPTTTEKENKEPKAEPVPQNGTLSILRGMRLLQRDGVFTGKSDPFVKIFQQGEQIHRTKTVDDKLNPVWAEGTETVKIQPGASIRLEVWEDDNVSGNDFMGCVTITQDQLQEYSMRPQGAAETLELKLERRENEESEVVLQAEDLGVLVLGINFPAPQAAVE